MTGPLIGLATLGLLTFYAFIWAICRASAEADRTADKFRHPAGEASPTGASPAPTSQDPEC